MVIWVQVTDEPDILYTLWNFMVINSYSCYLNVKTSPKPQTNTLNKLEQTLPFSKIWGEIRWAQMTPQGTADALVVSHSVSVEVEVEIFLVLLKTVHSI